MAYCISIQEKKNFGFICLNSPTLLCMIKISFLKQKLTNNKEKKKVTVEYSNFSKIEMKS